MTWDPFCLIKTGFQPWSSSGKHPSSRKSLSREVPLLSCQAWQTPEVEMSSNLICSKDRGAGSLQGSSRRIEAARMSPHLLQELDWRDILLHPKVSALRLLWFDCPSASNTLLFLVMFVNNDQICCCLSVIGTEIILRFRLIANNILSLIFITLKSLLYFDHPKKFTLFLSP